MFRITLRKAVPIDTATSQHPLEYLFLNKLGQALLEECTQYNDGTGGFCLLSGHRHTLGGWPPRDTAALASTRAGRGEGMVIQLCLSSAVCLSSCPSPSAPPQTITTKNICKCQKLLPLPLWSPPLCRLLFRMIFQGTHFIYPNPLMSSPSQLQPLPPAALALATWPSSLPSNGAGSSAPIAGLNFLSPQLFLLKTASLRYNFMYPYNSTH